MDKMADVLGRAGAWCGQNKYLSAIKNAFQNFMPLTIAGADRKSVGRERVSYEV